MARAPETLGVHPFPDPVGHFGAPWRPFEIFEVFIEAVNSVYQFVILDRIYFLWEELICPNPEKISVVVFFCFLFLKRFIYAQYEIFSYFNLNCDKNARFKTNISVEFLNILGSGATALQDTIPPCL